MLGVVIFTALFGGEKLETALRRGKFHIDTIEIHL